MLTGEKLLPTMEKGGASMVRRGELRGEEKLKNLLDNMISAPTSTLIP